MDELSPITVDGFTACLRPTEYEVSILPEPVLDRDAWSLRVAWRGPNSWAVLHGSSCLDVDGNKSYESSPSNREDEWLERNRFPLVEAIKIAVRHSSQVKVNGWTAEAVLHKWLSSLSTRSE